MIYYWNISVNEVYINHNNNVEAYTDKCVFITNQIFVSHGSNINTYKSFKNELKLVEKLHRRPSLHIIIKSEIPPSFNQLLFCNDSHIKYVHNITKYAEIMTTERDNYVLVLALHEHIIHKQDISKIILDKFINANLLNNDTIIVHEFWQNIHLPKYNDSDLEAIHKFSPKKIKTFKTENFTKAIGINSLRWRNKLNSDLLFN